MSFPRPAVALMQPTFLPWQGYFALLANVDVFVFLDDYQFCRRSFMQRNRLFLAPGNPGWITVPVEHVGSEDRALLSAVRPLLGPGFRRKFQTTLRHSYGVTPFYARYAPEIEAWITRDFSDLASFNIWLIQMMAAWLGLTPSFQRSSSIGSVGKRSVRLVDLLRRLQAQTYLSARGSFDYMVEDGIFPLEDIETRFQIFEPLPYPQRHSPQFVSHLSMLDAVLQVGAQQALELMHAGQKQFVAWHDMQSSARRT